MDKFLEKYNLPKLIRCEKIYCLTYLLMKLNWQLKPLNRGNSKPKVFTGGFYHTLKEEIATIIHKPFLKI